MTPPFPANLIYLAQTTSPTSDLSLVTLIGQLGISAVFLWLYLQANKERQQAQRQTTDILQTMAPTIQACTQTLERVHEAMTASVEATERQADIDQLKHQLGDLVAALQARGGGADGSYGTNRT